MLSMRTGPIAAYAERGDPIANQRGAVRGMHRWFSWDALNVTNATTCGGDKCYFQGEREGEGWLACWRRSPLMQQSKAWAFAEELRVDFGVNYLLRRSPFLATLSDQQAEHLNAKINISLDRRKHPPYRFRRKDGAKLIYAVGKHPVQAVRSCSWPECMVLKCTHIIRRHGPNNLTRLVGPKSLTAGAIEGFVAHAPNRTKLRLGMQRNFALVTAMIKAHPCLKRDFQVCVRNNGAVLNIDLDRCKRDKSGSVSLSDTEKSRLENETITLTTEPLRLTCPDSYEMHVRIFK